MVVNPTNTPGDFHRVASTGDTGLLDDNGNVRSGEFVDVLIPDPNETQWLQRVTALASESGTNPLGTKRVPYLIERPQ